MPAEGSRRAADGKTAGAFCLEQPERRLVIPRVSICSDVMPPTSTGRQQPRLRQLVAEPREHRPVARPMVHHLFRDFCC